MPEEASGIDVRVLRETADFKALEPAWRALWQADPNATPFQHPSWLLPWWRQFGQPDLRVITISDNDELMAIVPLYIYRDRQSGQSQLLLIGAGTSDYLDGIFAPACTPEHVAGALAVLQRDHSRDLQWDAGYLTQLRKSSKLFQALAISASPFPSEKCWEMRCVTLAHLPRKMRQNIVHHRNRARAMGTLESEIANESNCSAIFETLVALHNERWSQRGESGVLSDPRVLAWHREAVPLLARDGLLRLCALRFNGETIATIYALIDPDTRPNRSLYIYLPSFSPRYARLSPGSLLLADAIEHAANEGIQIVDMLRGDEPYKQFWHAEQTPTYGFELGNSAAQRPSAPLVEAA